MLIYNIKNKSKKRKAKVNNMKKTYKIEVDCANCANKMEEAAKNTAECKCKLYDTEDECRI